MHILIMSCLGELRFEKTEGEPLLLFHFDFNSANVNRGGQTNCLLKL